MSEEPSILQQRREQVLAMLHDLRATYPGAIGFAASTGGRYVEAPAVVLRADASPRSEMLLRRISVLAETARKDCSVQVGTSSRSGSAAPQLITVTTAADADRFHWIAVLYGSGDSVSKSIRRASRRFLARVQRT